MNITVFSFLMSIVWCNFFIIIIALIRRRVSFIINFNIMPLLFLIVVCVSRLFCFFEFPSAVVIPSTNVFPTIIEFFTFPILSITDKGISISILDVCLIIWAMGSIYLIQRYICQSIQLNRLLRTQQETENLLILACMQNIIAKSNKNTDVKIIQSHKIVVPMITGFFKPVIYLPDVTFTATELNNILLHEWTHFIHKDAWIKLFIYLICVIFWWNPFIHILKSNLNHILEVRCDLKLTSKMDVDSRIQYLESITKIIKNYLFMKGDINYEKLGNISSLVNIGNTKRIEQRFLVVLNYMPKKKYKLIRITFYMLLTLAFLISNMFIIQPTYTPSVSRGYEETFTMTPQTAYLKVNEDGTYALYSDGQYQGDIAATEISKEPLSLLPII